MDIDKAKLVIAARERMRKAVDKQLESLGVSVRTTQVQVKDKDGNTVIGGDGKPLTYTASTMAGISDDARELIEVFNERTPCWFKGCEGLRKQYNEEVGASNCTGCSGATRRKYMALARKLLDADPDRTVPKLH